MVFSSAHAARVARDECRAFRPCYAFLIEGGGFGPSPICQSITAHSRLVRRPSPGSIKDCRSKIIALSASDKDAKNFASRSMTYRILLVVGKEDQDLGPLALCIDREPISDSLKHHSVCSAFRQSR
jgi:hypothetical protein